MSLFLLDQDPFCGAIDCPYFGLSVSLSMGFNATMILSSAFIFTCMR